ncbi:MAG: glycosyltransferase family 4 protein [Gemmatimonadales bacterium]
MPEPLRHLLISREFPPASYPPGGIGTYAAHIARLLAEAGEVVHVIGERWRGAPEPREERCGGRLVVHRVAVEGSEAGDPEMELLADSIPAQRFAWQAARLAERLIEREGIDLIEAQEWEAPLYYFQLRRQLGLGPVRQPPCVVHLHSPSELIYHHNEWTGRPEYLTARRLEEFSIRAADAWFCPSQYLARQVSERYQVPLDAISVLPYPLGDSGLLQRPDSVWAKGSVLFVGRLEPRKGVIEFVDAAVSVARDHDDVSYDFVGDDMRYHKAVTVRRFLESRIPRGLRRRFRFHGVQPRGRLPGFLAAARMAVVPSRWENFPYSCLEAMSSGLPVIASPTGGMVEMIADGVTGWISTSQSAPDLAAALRRAVGTPPDKCAAMGRAAAESIRGLCGSQIATRRHLARRNELVRQHHQRAVPPTRPVATRRGLGAVVHDDGLGSTRAVDSIARLTTPPTRVIVLSQRDAAAPQALSRAIRSMIDDQLVAGVALVPASVALEPCFVERCEGALARTPDLGIISGWVDRGPVGFDQPTPAFPYQWLTDGVGDSAVIRAEAFLQAGDLRDGLPIAYALWDCWNAILMAGWKALAYPGVLATRDRSVVPTGRAVAGNEWHQTLRGRFPVAFARDAETVRALELLPASDREPRVREILRLPLRQQLGLAFDAVRRPREALRWLGDRISRATR